MRTIGGGRVCEHELDGFDAFVAARLPYLQRLGRALTGSDRAGAALVQEVLERTSLRWSRVESDDPESHVRRAMVARALTAWQRVRREAPAGRVPQPLDDDPRADDAVWRALAHLPARQRVVVALRYGEELSEAETAELLGVSPGSARHQARQAMARLRELLAEEPFPAKEERR
jgi:RNA polymerase sigma factor (sigma-70 family)